MEKAEAVADLINSQSLRAVRSARRSLSGTFSKKISLILTLLKNSLIQIEASIDFSEVSIGDTTRSLKDNLEKQKLELENLISDAKEESNYQWVYRWFWQEDRMLASLAF